METLRFFLQYFLTLFVIISPLSIVAFFVGITALHSVQERFQIAKTGCLVGGAVLIFFTITGRTIFEFFGISMGSFYIAGGILILLLGLDMLRSKDSEEQSDNAANGKKAEKPKGNIAITPLGVPMITGPACITAAIAQQSKAANWAEWSCGIVAVALVIYIIYLLLALSARGTKWLTPIVLRLTYKLSGLVLAALAIEMIVAGIKSKDLGLWPCEDRIESKVIVEEPL